MQHVQSSDAKARFSELLDQVERGETVVITRHGRPVARIVPNGVRHGKEVEAALEAIKKLRTKTGKIAVEEILSARDQGRE